MKRVAIVLGSVLCGAMIGYIIGSDWCAHLLNTGQIYDEVPYIPLDILDGSAYGKAFAIPGAIIGLVSSALIIRTARWYYGNDDLK